LNIRETFETGNRSKLGIFAHKIMNGDAYAKEKCHDFVCASFEFKKKIKISGCYKKMPFKSLPPKGESKKSKKKKKRSKRREEVVSSPKHVAPIIDYDNSNLDYVHMPVTYVSDHDWEKHSNFDIENLFGTNSKVNNCCTISTIHAPSYDDMFDEYALQDSYSIGYDDTKPLVYDGYDDEYNIFSSPIFEEKISYDYNMPPVFDDYGDENNYSCGEY
jgi:hypothetical protein